MRSEHNLNRIRNKLTGAEAVFHALMIHCDTVANTDGVEFKRNAAGISDSRFNLLCNFIKVHMTGNIIAF